MTLKDPNAEFYYTSKSGRFSSPFQLPVAAHSAVKTKKNCDTFFFIEGRSLSLNSLNLI